MSTDTQSSWNETNQADDPRAATRLLKKYDELVTSGQQPRRVTNFFCADRDGSLRADMNQHVVGWGMSGQLQREIRSYQLAKVDDTWAEAAHRNVSGFYRRTSYAKVAFTAASQRLNQTLASVDAMDAGEREFFYHCMRRCKAIGQQLPRRAQKLQGATPKRAALSGFVYRSDSSALRNWGAVLGTALSCLPEKQQLRRSLASRLQTEFLASVVTDGEVLSVPQLSDAKFGQLGHLALEQRPVFLLQTPLEERLFFMVVDKRAKRKKQLRTAALADRMAMGVSLQRLELWPDGEDGATGSTLAYHNGNPSVVDLVGLADWRVLRSGLCRWRSALASVPGCISLFGASTIDPARGWRDDSTPTLVLLEDLASCGWARGRVPEEHTLDSDKLFDVLDPLASKAYLRCLLGLSELLASGQLKSLRSDQLPGYYMCVLASDDPGSVPLGHTCGQYQLLLTRPDADAPPTVQADEDASNSEGSASSGEVVVHVRAAGKAVAKSKRRRAREGSSRVVQQQEWLDLVGMATVKQPRSTPPTVSPSAPVHTHEASGAASSSGQQVGVSSGQQCPHVPAASAPQAAGSSWQGQRVLLEGVEVHEEAHGPCGQPGSYRRLVVMCPGHAGKRCKCRKTRSFSERLGKQSGLGDLEPYAFLGLWLREHGRFEDAASHPHTLFA